MIFHPEGKWLVAVGGDHGGWLIFVNPKAMKIVRELKAPMHIHEFALNEKADTLYVVGHNKLVRWELEPEKSS